MYKSLCIEYLYDMVYEVDLNDVACFMYYPTDTIQIAFEFVMVEPVYIFDLVMFKLHEDADYFAL